MKLIIDDKFDTVRVLDTDPIGFMSDILTLQIETLKLLRNTLRYTASKNPKSLIDTPITRPYSDLQL